MRVYSAPHLVPFSSLTGSPDSASMPCYCSGGSSTADCTYGGGGD